MANTRSMTRNQNHDDEEASSSRKRPKACAPWSDLNHDVLNKVMMQLGVVDFLFFSGVCKSWRSLALSNRETFMASTPPVSVSIVSTDADVKECYLEDFKGTKYKTMLPDFTGGECIGLTCGYLVFFMRETRDFRLVNPITRHQLHFPDYPAFRYHPDRAILAFSASMSKWVFVVLSQNYFLIWFCIAGEHSWNHVYYSGHICDLHAFKGKIYAQTSSFNLSELRLDALQPKLTPLEVKQPYCTYLYQLVSSSENFYGIGWDRDYPNSLYELDLREMKWVKLKACEKTLWKYALFCSKVNCNVVAVKRESWPHGRYACTHDIRFITAHMWYSPTNV